MYPYFLVGILICRYEDFFFLHKKEFFFISVVVYAVLVFNNPTQEYDMYTHHFAWNTVILKAYLLRTVIGISASIAFIVLIREICIRIGATAVIRFLAGVGTFTLGIYVIHTEINQFFHQYMLHPISLLNPFNGTKYEVVFFDYAICLPASILITALCIITIKIIRKNKYTKLVLLGEK